MKRISKKSFEDVVYWKMGYAPLGEPSMFVHMYLIDGLLIDTGLPHLEQQVVKSLKKEQVTKIIVTHHHEDHSGNITAIKQAKDIEAWGSPKCSEILKKPPRVSPAQWITWGQNKKADVLPLDNTLAIVTEHFSFQIIETPGHAVDHICLYEPNKGWLVSGDIYVHDYIKVFMREESIYQQVQSIDRLLTLDFDVMFCGHNPQFQKAKERLQAKKIFLQEFFEKVKIAFERGQNQTEIMKTMNIKEDRWIKTLSLGRLSRLNMVRSVIRDLQSHGAVI